MEFISYASDWGLLSIERTDDWGEGAIPFIDSRPWYKKVFGIYDYQDLLLILLLPHFCLTIWMLSRMSVRVKKWTGILVFISFYAALSFAKPAWNFKGWEELFAILGAVYIFIPAFVLIMELLTLDNEKI
jgi:hypothetical protein